MMIKTYPTCTNIYVKNLHTSRLLLGSYRKKVATVPEALLVELASMASSTQKNMICRREKIIIPTAGGKHEYSSSYSPSISVCEGGSGFWGIIQFIYLKYTIFC